LNIDETKTEPRGLDVPTADAISHVNPETALSYEQIDQVTVQCIYCIA